MLRRQFMKPSIMVWGLFVLLPALHLSAQDNVTIPKSRLEELERKARELDNLKGDLNKTKQENEKLKQDYQAAVTNTVKAAPVVPKHPSPPISELPALSTDSVVEAMDLANYFSSDAQAADQRYKKRTFTVKGEIERFEKRHFGRYYSIIFKTDAPNTKVICEIYPPDSLQPVFTANHGSELMGTKKDDRITLAKAGAIATARGECKGLNGSAVVLSGCALTDLVEPRK